MRMRMRMRRGRGMGRGCKREWSSPVGVPTGTSTLQPTRVGSRRRGLASQPT